MRTSSRTAVSLSLQLGDCGYLHQKGRFSNKNTKSVPLCGTRGGGGAVEMAQMGKNRKRSEGGVSRAIKSPPPPHETAFVRVHKCWSVVYDY